MARFQPGHPKLGGKKKGSKNRKTVDLDVLARAGKDLDGPEYWANAYARILKGRAPHLENYFLPRLKGKPADQVELSGPDRKPLSITVRVVRD